MGKSKVDVICDSCGVNVSVCTVHDFKFDEIRTGIDWHLCPTCSVAWALRNLPAKTILKFREVAGMDTFLTHEDFYDEKGNACQPRKLKTF
jgi:hypothetical protein